MKSLNEHLRGRTSNSAFAWKVRIQHFAADLEQAASTRTPGAWATEMAMCASILNGFSVLKENSGQEAVDRKAAFLNAKPEVIIEMMKRYVPKIKERVARYRKEGINAQVKVTVNPKMARAREALARWQKANAMTQE